MRSRSRIHVFAKTPVVSRWVLATLLGLISLPLGWAILPTHVSAQVEDEDGDEQAFGLYPPVPRELRRPLNRAKQAIEAGEYAEATAELGRILDAEDQQDYFYSDRRNGENISLRTESMRLLGLIPPSDRKAYELQFGTLARKLVDHALASDSPDELAEASRRYFHTEAGYEATMLLGRHFFSRGEPGAAAAAFARVYEVEGARDRFEPSISLLLATSYLFTDQKDRARTILSDLKQRMPKVKTEVGGKNALVFEGDEDPLARLVAWVGESEQTVGAADSWLLHRGSATRTGVVENAEPHPVSMWSLPTAETPVELQVAAERRRELTKSGTSTTTVLSPLIVGDWVICRNVDGLIGVDRKTGRRVWKFPADDLETDLSPVAMGRSKGIDSQKQFVRQRIWDDAPYGQISSDGRAIYVVDGLGFSGLGGYRPGRNPFVLIPDLGMETRNRLVALDVQREGKQLWVAGDTDEADSPLANAFFLGAPIPVHGTLYALADIKGEVAIVALDAANGRFKWKQQVAQRDATAFRRDETQRLGGCSPSFADGLLVCPTALGCVVAVDPATRTLKWEYRYQQSNDLDGNRAFSPMLRSLLPLEKRWQENVILMPGKNIVLELVDSPNLYVLDRETGKVQWNRPRDDDHWIAATDKLVLTGGKSPGGVGRIRAWNLDDGTPAWNAPLSLGSASKVATGRGLANVARDTWYQPMSGREIWCISLSKGTVEKVLHLESDVGSLAVAGSTVVSQLPESIDCFMLSSSVQTEIESLSKSDPKSPWAAARRAELELASGNVDEAWQILSGFSTDNPPPALRAVLLRTMTALIRKDFGKWESLVEKARSLVASGADEHRFLDAYSEGIVQQGKASDVVVALLDYSRSLTDNSYTMSAELTERADDWAVQRSRWIAARLDRFYRSASAEDRKLIEQTVSKVVERLLNQDPSSDSLRIWSQLVAFHPASGTIRLRLAKLTLAGDDYLSVEQTLLPVVLDPKTGMIPDPKGSLGAGLYSREQQAAAWALLASAYERSNRLSAAAAAYGCLASHAADVALPTGENAGEWARVALSSEKFAKLETANDWSGSITTEIRTGPSKESRFSRLKPPMYFAPIVQATSAAMSRAKVAWDADTVVLLDSLGRELFATSWGKGTGNGGLTVVRPDKNVSQARIYGHTFVLSFGTEIVAFDTIRSAGREGSETSLWRDETHHRGPNTVEKIPTVTYENAWGTQPRSAAVTSSKQLIGSMTQITPWGIVYLQDDALICREIASGEMVWKRTGVPRGSDLLSTSSRVVCCPPESKQARAFSMIDGSELEPMEVPSIDRRMATCGSNVLTWKKEDDKVSLELRSLETQQVLFEYSTESKARGYLIDNREIAIATSEGKLTIHSLVDGAPLLTADIEPDDALQKLYVVKSNTGYMAIVATNTARPIPGWQFQAERTSEPLTTARIYSFDFAGKSQWARAARVSQQGFSMNQPSDLPVFAMFRRQRNTSERSSPAHSTMLVLDRRTGAVAGRLEEIQGNAITPPYLEPDVKQGTIHAILVAQDTKSLVLKFGGADAPNAEPIKDDAAFPEEKKPGEEGTGDNAAGGAVRGFFKALFPKRSAPMDDADDEQDTEEEDDNDPFG